MPDHFLLVEVHGPQGEPLGTYWQQTTEPGGEGDLLGLFDETGERYTPPNRSTWTVLTVVGDAPTPPWLGVEK
jgi:hypothetical protein